MKKEHKRKALERVGPAITTFKKLQKKLNVLMQSTTVDYRRKYLLQNWLLTFNGKIIVYKNIYI